MANLPMFDRDLDNSGEEKKAVRVRDGGPDPGRFALVLALISIGFFVNSSLHMDIERGYRSFVLAWDWLAVPLALAGAISSFTACSITRKGLCEDHFYFPLDTIIFILDRFTGSGRNPKTPVLPTLGSMAFVLSLCSSGWFLLVLMSSFGD